ncbi:MAG: hypothetical protein KC766_11180, partial [Myxococcales bacterium]|nr:hypothetical protein [Myxococcales bacterium]
MTDDQVRAALKRSVAYFKEEEGSFGLAWSSLAALTDRFLSDEVLSDPSDEFVEAMLCVSRLTTWFLTHAAHHAIEARWHDASSNYLGLVRLTLSQALLQTHSYRVFRDWNAPRLVYDGECVALALCMLEAVDGMREAQSVLRSAFREHIVLPREARDKTHSPYFSLLLRLFDLEVGDDDGMVRCSEFKAKSLAEAEDSLISQREAAVARDSNLAIGRGVAYV